MSQASSRTTPRAADRQGTKPHGPAPNAPGDAVLVAGCNHERRARVHSVIWRRFHSNAIRSSPDWGNTQVQDRHDASSDGFGDVRRGMPGLCTLLRLHGRRRRAHLCQYVLCPALSACLAALGSGLLLRFCPPQFQSICSKESTRARRCPPLQGQSARHLGWRM